MNSIKKIKISSIVIENRLRKDLGNIEILSKDIYENGLINPITVQLTSENQYKLLAGERRLEATKLLGNDYILANIIDVNNDEQALKIEIKENIERKTFNKEEIVLAGLELEKVEKEKAKKRQEAGVKVEDKSDAPIGRVDDIVSEFLNIGSRTQYVKCKFIVENKSYLSSDEFYKWNNNILSTNKAYNLIKSRYENNSNPQKNLDIDLKSWKKSFNNMNITISSSINKILELKETVPIWNNKGRDITDDVIYELNDYMKKANNIQKIFDEMKYDDGHFITEL